VLKLAQRFGKEKVPSRIVTFTRAATAELLDKIKEEGHNVTEPTTLHSFALSALMRNPGRTDLSEPLRIPDSYEQDKLIWPDIARLLRELGYEEVTKNTVKDLEREMACRWEGLDPDYVLLSEVKPQLRDAYVGTWQEHRAVYGYSLFAEMANAATELLEDHDDLKLEELAILIVDEYQDLNKSEIRFITAIASRGAKVLAVGDDDQSIYSWRMADPLGIQQFPNDFDDVIEYTLSTSFRCGKRILQAAAGVIQAMPGRPAKKPVQPQAGNAEGECAYLRFADQTAEQLGAAGLIHHLVNVENVPASSVAVLLRGDRFQRWSTPVRKALADVGIESVDVEAAVAPLSEKESRRLLCLARLADNDRDDLAWWGLLRLANGISEEYVEVVYAEAVQARSRFASKLLSLAEQDVPPSGGTASSHNAMRKAVAEALKTVKQLEVSASDEGWAEWLLDTADQLAMGVSPEFRDLAVAVGRVTPQSLGLRHFLNQLEPVTKDLALKTPGVAIMTIARSKGLTFNVVVVMGVEDGLIPFFKAKDTNEERRLLYVAMTRPREFLYLTMAKKRTDVTAHSGKPNVGSSRSRSPLLKTSGLSPIDGDAYVNALGS
jgi:superfamily I DNA/RNA helicase